MTTTDDVPAFGSSTGPAAHDPLPDPDTLPVVPTSPLAALEADIAAEIAPPVEVLEVPYRPGYTVVYSCGIDGDSGKQWAKLAKDTSSPDGIDRVKYSAVILANLCIAIHKDGQPIGDAGDEITFRTPDLQRLLGADRAHLAVRLFYGGPKHLGDGHIINHANRVTARAGYNDADLTAADPTPG